MKNPLNKTKDKKTTKKETPVDETAEKRVEVETPNGATKTVTGTDAAEVDEQVKAAKSEKKIVQPDINDPADGNKHYAEFQED